MEFRLIYVNGGRVGRGRSGRRVENLRCRQAKAEKTSSAALWPARAWVGDGAAALVCLGGVSDALVGTEGAVTISAGAPIRKGSSVCHPPAEEASFAGIR